MSSAENTADTVWLYCTLLSSCY